MLALVVATAAAAAGVHMDIGTPLEQVQRSGCAYAKKGTTTVGTAGGEYNYRAAVDDQVAGILAAAYRKAHGKAPARVKRRGDGVCTTKVPALSHAKVATDAAGARKKLAGRLCLAIYNANYNIDQITISEWAVRYDSFARAERAARRAASDRTKVPDSAAVRKTCAKA